MSQQIRVGWWTIGGKVTGRKGQKHRKPGGELRNDVGNRKRIEIDKKEDFFLLTVVLSKLFSIPFG